jgi:hypothetical protein
MQAIVAHGVLLSFELEPCIWGLNTNMSTWFRQHLELRPAMPITFPAFINSFVGGAFSIFKGGSIAVVIASGCRLIE